MSSKKLLLVCSILQQALTQATKHLVQEIFPFYTLTYAKNKHQPTVSLQYMNFQESDGQNSLQFYIATDVLWKKDPVPWASHVCTELVLALSTYYPVSTYYYSL